MVQQCEFEEFLDSAPPPNYEGPFHTIESNVEYNMHHQEHIRRQQCLTTA
jgi:hypothetical protein